MPPIEIFPKPVQDYITVRCNAEVKLISVVNTVGQVVKQFYRPMVQNGIVLLNMQDIPTGLYIIQISTASGTVQKVKMVKR